MAAPKTKTMSLCGFLGLVLLLLAAAGCAQPKPSASSSPAINTNLVLRRLIHAFSETGEGSEYTNSVTFAFAPAHGTKCTEDEVRTVQTYSPSGAVRPEMREEHSSEKWTIRRTENEVLFIKRITSFAAEINGEVFKSPAAPVLKGLITTNSISFEGKYLKSSFNKDIIGELRKRLPRIPTGAGAGMNNDFLAATEKIRWEELTESLIGRTIQQKQSWEREIPWGGAYGKIHVYEKVVMISPSGRRLLVSVLTIGSSDPTILQRFPLENASSLDAPVLHEFFGWVATGKPLAKLCIRRIIDANTMLPVFEEQVVQKVNFRNAQPVIVTESNRRRYDYPN